MKFVRACIHKLQLDMAQLIVFQSETCGFGLSLNPKSRALSHLPSDCADVRNSLPKDALTSSLSYTVPYCVMESGLDSEGASLEDSGLASG